MFLYGEAQVRLGFLVLKADLTSPELGRDNVPIES